MEIVINLCLNFKLREECNILKIDTFEILATLFLKRENLKEKIIHLNKVKNLENKVIIS